MATSLTDFANSGEQSQKLPPLRQELKLLPGPTDADGRPSWTIHDPVRNRFHRISREAYDLLTFWHLGNGKAVADAVEKARGQRPHDASIEWLTHFLRTNFLVQQHSKEGIQGLARIAAAGKRNLIRRVLGQYLFFRIPLVRPQKFLDATANVADILTSRAVIATVLLLGLVGLFLVVRQWDAFTATFLHFFTWEGVLWYGLALIFTKILHELGHAYTAVRAGCRVPTMGVAFLVLWPVLYTDTSDSWRLVSRRKRLGIGAAGMSTELLLACLATFLWSFLPDGPVRSAAFLIATVTWVMTLAVNLNPFMRFDGYYLLSDALGVENLQDRAFNQAKWWLREKLFGFKEPPPEVFSRRMGRFLIIYAVATWLYRLVLFAGIALLVYGMFFKVLGVLLFLAEIILLIVMPIWREIKAILKRRGKIRFNRQLIVSIVFIFLLLGWISIPWRTEIDVPAYIVTKNHSVVFAPEAARIKAINVHRGQRIDAGQPLITLSSDELVQEIRKVKLSIQMRAELIRREAAGGQERARIQILRQDMQSDQARLETYNNLQNNLNIRARLSGVVAQLDEQLHVGMYINENQSLMVLADPQQLHAVGYIAENRLNEIQSGDTATFYPDDATRTPVEMVVTTVAAINSTQLDEPYLASTYGGPIAVEQDDNQRLVPVEGIYRVVFEPLEQTPAPGQIIRGVIKLDGEPHSLIADFMRKAYSVLLREGNF